MLPVIGASLLAAVLLVAGFYRMTRVCPDSADLEFVRRHDLYTSYVLRILESADYQFFARKNRRYRDFLFESYARNLEKDMAELARSQPGWTSALFLRLYRGVYRVLRCKRRFNSNIGDLRLLLGIALALVRRLVRS